MSLITDLWDKGANWYDTQPVLTQSLINPLEASKNTVHGLGGTPQGGIQPDPISANPNMPPPSNPGKDAKKTGIGNLGEEANKPPVVAPAPNGTAGTPVPTNYDWTALADYLKQSRNKDLAQGLDFGGHFFGMGNPQMAEIENTRRQRAMGLNGAEVQNMRETASSGINQQMATGLRANRAAAAANGVHGGAAVGANSSVLARANQSRADAERGIALADMQRRGDELNKYEGTVTNERAGLLGTGLGFANQGAQDQYGAMQYGLGQDFMDSYKAAAGAKPDLGGDKPWGGEAFGKWKEGGYKPGQDPIADWLRNNVYDVEGHLGVDAKQYTPQSLILGNRN